MDLEIKITKEMVEDALLYKCPDCGSFDFKKTMRFKRLSRVLVGTIDDMLIPQPTIVCAVCGLANKEIDNLLQPNKPLPL